MKLATGPVRKGVRCSGLVHLRVWLCFSLTLACTMFGRYTQLGLYYVWAIHTAWYVLCLGDTHSLACTMFGRYTQLSLYYVWAIHTAWSVLYIFGRYTVWSVLCLGDTHSLACTMFGRYTQLGLCPYNCYPCRSYAAFVLFLLLLFLDSTQAFLSLILFHITLHIRLT